MTTPKETLVQSYFKTLRSVHGDEVVDKMLTSTPQPTSQPRASEPAPFIGHTEARRGWDDE